MMDTELHDRDLDPGPNRRDVGTRSVWLRAARSLFAIFCLVAASLAGSASGRVSPAPIGAAEDTAARADAQRDAGRSLLRPHAEIVTQGPIRRSGDAGGPNTDSNSGAVLVPWQSVAWLGEDGVGSVASLDCGARWLAVRAGYSRAPPTAIGRIRTAA